MPRENIVAKCMQAGVKWFEGASPERRSAEVLWVFTVVSVAAAESLRPLIQEVCDNPVLRTAAMFFVLGLIYYLRTSEQQIPAALRRTSPRGVENEMFKIVDEVGYKAAEVTVDRGFKFAEWSGLFKAPETLMDDTQSSVAQLSEASETSELSEAETVAAKIQVDPRTVPVLQR